MQRLSQEQKLSIHHHEAGEYGGGVSNRAPLPAAIDSDL
jgi:hypothetical protein